MRKDILRRRHMEKLSARLQEAGPAYSTTTSWITALSRGQDIEPDSSVTTVSVMRRPFRHSTDNKRPGGLRSDGTDCGNNERARLIDWAKQEVGLCVARPELADFIRLVM
jgi:hypothetical protein